MKRHVLIVIGLLAFVVGGCAQYQEKKNFFDIEEADPAFVARYDLGPLTIADQEHSYPDSVTGILHENAYYVDPAGWSINEISPLEDYYSKFWLIYENKNAGYPPYVKAWYAKQAQGVHKLLFYAADHGTAQDFLVFPLTFPEGMELLWDGGAMELHVAENGRHIMYVSHRIFFTRETQFYPFCSCKGPVVVSHGNGWDDASPRSIVAVVRFDFHGKRPSKFLFCRPQKVIASGEAVSTQ